jgi:hypothetical protein
MTRPQTTNTKADRELTGWPNQVSPIRSQSTSAPESRGGAKAKSGLSVVDPISVFLAGEKSLFSRRFALVPTSGGAMPDALSGGRARWQIGRRR